LAELVSEALAFDPWSLLQPVVAKVPATNPAMAAEMTIVRAVRVINVEFPLVLLTDKQMIPAIHKWWLEATGKN
jgi:hypothetical protein